MDYDYQCLSVVLVFVIPFIGLEEPVGGCIFVMEVVPKHANFQHVPFLFSMEHFVCQNGSRHITFFAISLSVLV